MIFIFSSCQKVFEKYAIPLHPNDVAFCILGRQFLPDAPLDEGG